MGKHNWTYKKLGEVAKITSGKSIPSSEINNDFSDGLYPCFGGNGIRGYVNRYSYDGLYPIVGRVGALCGNVHLSQGRFYATEHALVVTLKTNDNPKYIEHILTHLNLRKYAKGVAQPVLSASTLSTISIPIPPLAEQERIVAELDLLSSIIEKKKAQLKELDQLAQSIFYDMFGDPITNEKGWEVKKLGEVCEYSKTRIKSEELTAENYVGVENLLQDCKGKVAANKVPDDMGLTEYIEGDVLIGNIRPYLKKIWLANNRGGCNGDVLAIRIQSDYSNHFLPIYIFGCLSKDAFFDFDMQYSKGEKMPRGDRKEIVKYPICFPPLPLQQEFAEKVEAIDRQKTLIQQSIDEVQTLFNSRMDYWFG